MIIRVVCIILIMAGCTPVPASLDDRLDPVATVLIPSDANMKHPIKLRSPQPQPYAAIIDNTFDELATRFDSNLAGLSILRLRAKQGHLPQFTPGASAGTGGVAVVNLGVSQVLFDGQRYQAQFSDANIKSLSRQITLLDQLNETTRYRSCLTVYPIKFPNFLIWPTRVWTAGLVH